MERVGASVSRGADDRIDRQEVEGARPVGYGDDRLDPETDTRPRDAGRDLAAVGDEQVAYRRLVDVPSVSRGVLVRARRSKRVKCANRDTPPTTDASCRQRPVCDPTLNAPGRGPDSLRCLARAQLMCHCDAIVAIEAAMRNPVWRGERRICGPLMKFAPHGQPKPDEPASPSRREGAARRQRCGRT